MHMMGRRKESHFIRDNRDNNRPLSKLDISWENLPQNILIVHKETDLDVLLASVEELINWLHAYWTKKSSALKIVGIYTELLKNKIDVKLQGLVQFYPSDSLITQEFDLIITLGGDGTVLLAAWLFQNHAPPIIPFHFGTLGFLTIFNWETFSPRLCSIFSSGSRFCKRMRLNCIINKAGSNSFEYNVLNEIVIERGASPFMSILDFFGDDHFLTKIQADGVAIATPTGSTAYSVSRKKTIYFSSQHFLFSFLRVVQLCIRV
jgi:NAD kinase